MKKTFATLALAVLATSASAAVTGFATYDYDRANNGQGLSSQQELNVGVAVDTKLGTFDGSVVGSRFRAGAQDDALGFEVGYTNGLKLGAVGVKGRVGYGRLNQVAGGNNEYYSLGAEASLPVTSTVTAFAGYRHRNGLNAATADAQNRFTVGADVSLTKNVSLRAGYAFTKQAGVNFNGLTTAVAVKF